MTFKKTRPRIQIDPIECGAVALGIILEYYGSFVPSQKLRELAKVSTSGSSAKSIMDAAVSLGLKAKAHKILASDIKKLPTPAILFVDQCHFVVFEGHFLGKFYINDPAFGRYVLNREQFRKRFSRIAITLRPTNNFFESKNAVSVEPRLMLYSLGIFSAILFSVFAAFLGLLAGRGHELLFSPLFILGSLGVIFGLGVFLQAIFLQIFYGKNVQESESLEKSLHRVPSNFFDNLPFMVFQRCFLLSNSIKTKSANHFLWAFLVTILIVIGFISLPTLVVLLFACLLLVFQVGHGEIASKKFDLKRSMSVALDMKAMGQEEYLLSGLMKPFIKCPKKTSVHFFAFWLLGLILALTYVWVRAWHLDELSLSEIFSLKLLIFAVIFFTQSFGHKNLKQNELKSLERELSFASTEDPKNIKKPDFLAVVYGHDDYSLLTFADSNWRIGLIDDDSHLFDGTLKDNLSLFKVVKDSDLMKALEISEATEIFYSRPLGLLTPIFALGKNLSQSEKKRLLLAQALVNKPDILLLDDFFSALDEKIAIKILHNLKSQNISTVFTSFRNQELLLSSEVIFIGEQKIVGQHQELKKNPQYQELITN